MGQAINRSQASKIEQRENAHERMYKSQLKRKYGMTLVEYENLLKKQNGLCAICQQPETVIRHKRVSRLSVDHSHVTGEVRGLLCYKCNAVLGFMKDDILKLQAAIVYLRKQSTD